jgi:hypothetical protein
MNDSAARQLSVLRLIITSMMLALLAATIIMIVLAPRLEQSVPPEVANLLLIVLAGLAVSQLPVYFFVRHTSLRRLQAALAGREVTADVTRSLHDVYFRLTLVPAALLEGWGLLGSVIFLLTQQWPALAAPALALCGLMFAWPTRDRLERFTTAMTGRPAPW